MTIGYQLIAVHVDQRFAGSRRAAIRIGFVMFCDNHRVLVLAMS